MLPDLKKDFSRFLKGHEGCLHFAAHSHHFWPDVSYDAQMQAWEDAALASDRKWHQTVKVLDSAKTHIARILDLPDPQTICFAPNTHEFVMRLFSCFPAQKKLKILTTNSEFHSFRRQLDRLGEEGLVEFVRIDTEPFDSFSERFIEAAQSAAFDMIYLSHVFYDFSFVADIQRIASALKNQESFFVIDGYHGFMAVPTDLSAISDRVFYIAGGYKYAMAGEGACFMHCPAGYGARPRDTGWFADFENLATPRKEVFYAKDASRFAGATFDPVGIYRLNAVLGWLHAKNITVDKIHTHSLALQEYFLEKTAGSVFKAFVPKEFRGNFLTFKLPQAGDLQKSLLEKGVITDNRGDRLRFGFGVYHDIRDIDALVEKVKVHVR